MRPETLEGVRAHALESPDTEVCGFIVRVSGEERVIRSENRHPAPDAHFSIAAQDFADAEDLGEIVAIYHSHVRPGTTERPGIADRMASTRLGIPYLVYSTARDLFGTYEPERGASIPLENREWVDGVLDCYTVVQDYFAALRECRRCREWSCTAFAHHDVCRTCGGRDFGPQRFDFPDVQRGTYLYSTPEELRTAGSHYLDHVPKNGWLEIPGTALRRHDGMLMKFAGVVTHHAAVYLGDGMMFHHPHGGVSRREVFGDHMRKRVTHYCRHEILMRPGDIYRKIGEVEWSLHAE